MAKAKPLPSRTFLRPSSPKLSDQPSSKPSVRAKRRQSTLYDAVASRISSHGFIPRNASQLYYTSSRTTTSSTLNPLPPEEVLFSRKNAPPRYEEYDPYFPVFASFAEENRVKGELLPDGELCAALHAYAADFYAALGQGREGADFKSMDETALLALGILVEEMAGWVLERNGGKGEGVFVEGEDEDEGVERKSVITRYEARVKSGRTRKEKWARERAKRRRLDVDDEEDEVDKEGYSEADEDDEMEDVEKGNIKLDEADDVSVEEDD